jgi:hypothetical protein
VTPAVVFDTNVCRGLTGANLSTVVEQERRRGVAQYADQWVMVELLAHLADEADPDYGRCRRAVQGIVSRCALPRGVERPCGILSDSESLLARIITGVTLPEHATTSKALMESCLEVALTPDGEPLTSIAPTLKGLASHMTKMEAEFAAGLQKNRREVMARLEQEEEGKRREIVATSRREIGESDVMRDVFALHVTRAAYRLAGLPVPDPLDPRVVREVRRIAAVGIEFYAQIVRKVMYDGLNVDAPKNRNLMWDHRISYNIGNEVDRGPIWLVTDDPAFVEAATPVGFADRVKTVAAYQSWLSHEAS